MAPSTATAKTPPSSTYLQEYNGTKLVAVSVALMVLEILCVGLRFISRRLSKTATGLDDWLIGPSFVFRFGLTVIAICMYSVRESLPTLLETTLTDRRLFQA